MHGAGGHGGGEGVRPVAMDVGGENSTLHVSAQGVLSAKVPFLPRGMKSGAALEAWLDSPITMDEWKAWKAERLRAGDSKALGFKATRDALLSTTLGLMEKDVAELSDSLSSVRIGHDARTNELTLALNDNNIPAPLLVVPTAVEGPVTAAERAASLLRSTVDPRYRTREDLEEDGENVYSPSYARVAGVSRAMQWDEEASCYRLHEAIVPAFMIAAFRGGESVLKDSTYSELHPEVRECLDREVMRTLRY